MPTAADHPSHRETVIVDASLLVSVLIDPAPDVDAAAVRMAKAHLLAPSVLPFEVANVLGRRRNAGLLSPAEASVAFSESTEMPIELWPFEMLAERVWQLGHNLSAYDASYVALAEMVSAPLLTRDRRLANAPGNRCTITVY